MKNFNKDKFLAIGILPLMWLAYFLFEIITGRVKDSYTFILNFCLIFVFALIGYSIYIISNKYINGIESKKIFFMFLLAMIIDQGGKVIIKLFFFDKYFELIPNFLSFNPIINTDGSWLNARFGAGVSFSFLIFLNLISLIIFWELYRYSLFKNNKEFWSDMCFLFIFSGALCSLIDKVFYGGSLDFIGISDLFIADIKDIYINLGILFFIMYIYKNDYIKDDTTTFKEDLLSIKNFLLFIKNDLFKK